MGSGLALTPTDKVRYVKQVITTSRPLFASSQETADRHSLLRLPNHDEGHGPARGKPFLQYVFCFEKVRLETKKTTNFSAWAR